MAFVIALMPTARSVPCSATGAVTAVAVASGVAVLLNYRYIRVYHLGLPGPSSLRIAPTAPNSLLLSWPAPNPAFAVQDSPAANSTQWLTLTNFPVVGEGRNQVMIGKPEGARFYRLISQ